MTDVGCTRIVFYGVTLCVHCDTAIPKERLGSFVESLRVRKIDNSPVTM